MWITEPGPGYRRASLQMIPTAMMSRERSGKVYETINTRNTIFLQDTKEIQVKEYQTFYFLLVAFYFYS
jgi:hypothetical protein